MSQSLALTFWILDERFHGRGDGGDPEWPPSPFRAWQSLVAAGYALQRGGLTGVVDALRWFEQADAPTILTPRSALGARIPTFVPNNDGDLPGGAKKAMKHVRSRTLADGRLIYLWPGSPPAEQRALILAAARAVHSLGWGFDLAVANVDAGEVAPHVGERWTPGRGGTQLRVPGTGSLEDLDRRYQEFTRRMAGDELAPPGPSTAFRRVGYAREGDRHVSHAAFVFKSPDPGDSRMVAFDTTRHGLTVAGMVRGAARVAAERQGWSEADVRSLFLGHGEPSDDPAPTTHLAFLPLPTVEFRGNDKNPSLGSVRRVLLVAGAEDARHAVEWCVQGLAGAPLVDERSGRERAILEPVEDDGVLAQYVRPSSTWASVTPVVLPGFDDKGGMRKLIDECSDPDRRRLLISRLDRRIDGLIRKAIQQAGLGPDLAQHAELQWQREPFWRGGQLAERYGVPKHAARYPRFHVRIRWRDEQGRPLEVPGPLFLGRGRFYGVGLFAAADD